MTSMPWILAVIVVLMIGLAEGIPNTSIAKQVCTARHYQENRGGYDICTYYVTEEVVTMTAKRGYSYSVEGRSHEEFTGKCYGHGACNGLLSLHDCTSCLRTALSKMASYCTSSVGAQTKLEDCRIRYEDHPFDPDY